MTERFAVGVIRGQMAMQRSDPDGAARQFTAAHAVAATAGVPDLADEATVLLAANRRIAGRPAAADDLAELERIASSAGSARTRYRALLERGLVDRDAGRFEEARTWLARAVEVATPLGLNSAGKARGSYGALLHLTGDAEGGLEALLAAQREVPGAMNKALMGVGVASALRTLRRFEEAEREYLAVEETLAAAGHRLAALARFGRALLLWTVGREERGDRLLDEALPELELHLPGLPGLVAVARLARVADDPDDSVFEAARAHAERTPLPPAVWTEGMPCLALAVARARHAGREDRAARLRDLVPAGARLPVR